MRHVLVTGGAGFIGSHIVDRLLDKSNRVTVLDNFDAFYSRSAKLKNVRTHKNNPSYSLIEGDIRQVGQIDGLKDKIDVIVHLAAKGGVRPSLQDPLAYQDVNVKGTHCLLEFAQQRQIQQFIFSSSSSVYGVNPRVPWSESDHVLLPISPYASTKVSGELLGHVYSHLYGLRFIALRFFTVYGPRQRPDLAIHKMARLMLEGRPVPIFGKGATRRDYTFIDDIVDAIDAAINYTGSSFEVVNLGNNQTVSLLQMVQVLQQALGVTPELHFFPEQPGDVPQTWADISKAKDLLGYNPRTAFEQGVEEFVKWLRADEATNGS